MNKAKKRVLIVIVAVVIVIGAIGVGSYVALARMDLRDYKADIVATVPNSDVVVVIKEGSFLLGSGAEIYVLHNEKEILLGETSGADDGYCPFSAGKYEILNNGDGSITVRWFLNNADGNELWEEKRLDVSKYIS